MAAIGIAIGVAIASHFLGKLLTPVTKVEGARLDDTSIPKSEYGKNIPKIIGTQRVIGNLMWGQPLREDTVKTTTGGGKGGGVETTSYYYYGTAAWLLADAEDTSYGLNKVFANGKIIYNANSGTGAGAAGSTNWQQYFTFYDGSQTSTDPTIASFEGARTPQFRGKCYIVFDDLPLELFGNRMPEIRAELYSKAYSPNPTLKQVVDAICLAAGIDAGDIDTTQLTGNLKGFLIPQNGERHRDLLEKLGQVYFFYGFQKDTKVLFFRHFQRPESVVSVPPGNLSVRPFGSEKPDSYSQTKTFPIELPATVKLSFQNVFANFETDAQYAFRTTNVESLTDIAQNSENYDTTLALTRSEAYSFAHRILHQIWATRIQFKEIKLSPKWLNALEPGEVFSLPLSNGSLLPVQITRVELGANMVVTIEAQIYDGNIVYEVVPQDETIESTIEEPFSPNWNGAGEVVALDIPGVGTANRGIYLGVKSDTPTFTAADVHRSSDQVNYDLLFTVLGQIKRGETTTLLDNQGPNMQFYVDRVNTLTVVMENGGTLSSLTDFDFYNLNQVLLVGNELICARTATLVATDTYELTDLLRGLYGTENFIGNHAIVENVFVLPENFNIQTDTPLNVIRHYAALSGYDDFNSVDITSKTWTGVSAKAYYPTNLTVTNRHTEGLMRFKWERRSKGFKTWSDSTSMPLTENQETYSLFLNLFGNSKTIAKSVIVNTRTYDYTELEGVNDGIISDDFELKDEDGNNVLDENSQPIEFNRIYEVSIVSVTVQQENDLLGFQNIGTFQNITSHIWKTDG